MAKLSKSVKVSLIISGGLLVLNFIGMGIVGAVFAMVVSPITNLYLPHFNDMHGDWVWPTMIMAGFFSALLFIPAGMLNSYLIKKAINKFLRMVIYSLAIYIPNLLLWSAILWTHLDSVKS